MGRIDGKYQPEETNSAESGHSAASLEIIIHAVANSYRPRSMFPPRLQSMVLLLRGFSIFVTQRNSDVCCVGATRPIPNSGPSGHFTLRPRMGWRARIFDSNQNRTVAFTRTEKYIGTLVSHGRVTGLRIRRNVGRELHFFAERRSPISRTDAPRPPEQTLPDHPTRPRIIRIRSQARSLVRNLDQSPRKRQNPGRPPNEWVLHLEI